MYDESRLRPHLAALLTIAIAATSLARNSGPLAPDAVRILNSTETPGVGGCDPELCAEVTIRASAGASASVPSMPAHSISDSVTYIAIGVPLALDCCDRI